MAVYGKRAKVSFTGHSLGGSLAVLLSLMFRCRGVVPVSALSPVYTFGAPSVLNGGNQLLQRLGFSPRHIQAVVISRDLVPRIFASDIPEQIVEVLKHINQSFRKLPTFLNHQVLLLLHKSWLEVLQHTKDHVSDDVRWCFFTEAIVHHHGTVADIATRSAAGARASAFTVRKRALRPGASQASAHRQQGDTLEFARR